MSNSGILLKMRGHISGNGLSYFRDLFGRLFLLAFLACIAKEWTLRALAVVIPFFQARVLGYSN